MAITLNQWTQILSSAPWSPRRLHRSIFANGYVYICGGTNDVEVGGVYEKYNDVWRSSDGVTWELVTAGADWLERAAHAFIFFDNKFWVIAGSGPNTNQFLNDVWYSSDAINWTLATSSPGWVVRHEFGCVVFDNKIWVIGGFNGSTLSDVWYSSNGITWTQATSNFGMAVREHVVANFMGKLWVYGGDLGGSSYTNSMYSSLDGSSWNFEGNAAWGARREHELINVTGEDRLVILGGYNGSDLNDVWESTDGTTWTNVPQLSPFPIRGDFGFTDDGFQAYIIGGKGGTTYYNDVWIGNIFISSEFSASPLSGTSNLLVNFTDESLGDPDSWEWDFGDGSPHSTAQNPSHTYTDVGIYTVSLTITKSGYPDNTTVKTDYITVGITADFSASPLTVLSGYPVSFTDESDSTPDTWEWDFGDGSPHSFVQNPSHAYSSAGTYSVTLTVTKNSVSDSITKPNYISVGIVAEFTAQPIPAYINMPVQFTDQSLGDPDSWLWNFGDGAETSTIQNPTHSYAQPGLYTIILTITKGSFYSQIFKEHYVSIVLEDIGTGFVRDQGPTLIFD